MIRNVDNAEECVSPRPQKRKAISVSALLGLKDGGGTVICKVTLNISPPTYITFYWIVREWRFGKLQEWIVISKTYCYSGPIFCQGRIPRQSRVLRV